MTDGPGGQDAGEIVAVCDGEIADPSQRPPGVVRHPVGAPWSWVLLTNGGCRPVKVLDERIEVGVVPVAHPPIGNDTVLVDHERAPLCHLDEAVHILENHVVQVDDLVVPVG